MSFAASYVVLDEPEFTDAVVTLGDLYGTGTPSLIVAEGNRIYSINDGHEETLIQDISGQVTVIAVGDVSGNDKNDLVIATTNGGALYSFSENRGIWEVNGQPIYFWDTISSLIVQDINNDGYDDVILLTEKGELQILLSWEGKFLPFWKSPENQKIADFKVADINGNNHQEIIYTVTSGYISILAWDDQELITLWENYPWGSIDSLVVVANEMYTEWLVITSQKMLYGWRFQNGEIITSKQFQASELGEKVFHIPEQGLLSFSSKTGVSLFDLRSSSVIEKWNVPGVLGSDVFYHDNSFYFLDKNHDYQRLVEASGMWRVFMYDEEITAKVNVVELEGKLYYKLSDLAQLWDFKFFEGYDWYFWQNQREIILDISSEQIIINSFAIPLIDSIVKRDDALYCTSEILSFFGWNAEVNSSRQRVIFVKNWGWWL